MAGVAQYEPAGHRDAFVVPAGQWSPSAHASRVPVVGHALPAGHRTWLVRNALPSHRYDASHGTSAVAFGQ